MRLSLLILTVSLLLAGCNTQDWDTESPNEVPGGWDDIQFHRPGEFGSNDADDAYDGARRVGIAHR